MRRRLAAKASGWLLLGAIACSKTGNGRPEGGPRIACTATSHDFGAVLEGDRLAHGFRLRNDGHSPLHVLRIDGSYGCSAPVPGRPIAPGAEATLDVVCDTRGRQEAVVDRLIVHSDDPVRSTLELHVEARIEPLLGLTSRTIELRTPFGGGDAREVRVTGKLASVARLAVRSVLPPGPRATIVSSGEGAPEGLRLELAGDKVGRASGQVILETGLREPTTLTVLYSSEVTGSLTVDPTHPVIDAHAAGPAGVDFKVSSTRPDFRLDGAIVIEGPFLATFRRDAGGLYSVHVVVHSGRSDDSRGQTGVVRLLSNDPAEPARDVPLLALGPLGAHP